MAKTFKIGGEDVNVRITVGMVENIQNEIREIGDENSPDNVRIIITSILDMSDAEYRDIDMEDMKEYLPVIQYATKLMNEIN